ncbi:MAG TPA: exodeoxyribonuclease VII small subunit [Candidatus Thermoplasmatota archaeon]|nr:exodeoxyribonuclease VII small subunit [Candidatus Thermoplasmatota archaeon]
MTATTAVEESFEARMARLEALVRELEGGGLGLDASMRKFEEAVGLVRGLREQLARAESRVLELTKDGQIRELRLDA